MTQENLRRTLIALDGRGYKAYNDILGSYDFSSIFVLFVDRIQSDPFAPPSNFRARIQHEVAKFPPEMYNNKIRYLL